MNSSESRFLEDHREQYGCGNSIYDYITGGPEVVLARRRQARRRTLLGIAILLVLLPGLLALMFHLMTDPPGTIWPLIFGSER